MRRLKRYKDTLLSSDAAGKGLTGCVVAMIMLGIFILISMRVGPPYFAVKSFEADVKKEASRAGANAMDDETVVRNLLDLARRNEMHLDQENIRIERYAGQIHIKIHYTMPLDLIVYQRDLDFNIEASSYVGRL